MVEDKDKLADKYKIKTSVKNKISSNKDIPAAKSIIPTGKYSNKLQVPKVQEKGLPFLPLNILQNLALEPEEKQAKGQVINNSFANSITNNVTNYNTKINLKTREEVKKNYIINRFFENNFFSSQIETNWSNYLTKNLTTNNWHLKPEKTKVKPQQINKMEINKVLQSFCQKHNVSLASTLVEQLQQQLRQVQSFSQTTNLTELFKSEKFTKIINNLTQSTLKNKILKIEHEQIKKAVVKLEKAGEKKSPQAQIAFLLSPKSELVQKAKEKLAVLVLEAAKSEAGKRTERAKHRIDLVLRNLEKKEKILKKAQIFSFALAPQKRGKLKQLERFLEDGGTPFGATVEQAGSPQKQVNLSFGSSSRKKQLLAELEALVVYETIKEQSGAARSRPGTFGLGAISTRWVSRRTKLNFVQSEDRQQRLNQLQELVRQETSFERISRKTKLNFVQSEDRQQRLKQLQELVKQETSFERISRNTKLNFVQSEDRQQRLKQLQELVRQETSFEQVSRRTELNFVQSVNRQQRLKQLQELVRQETSFERTSRNTKLNFVQSVNRQQRLKQLQELVKQETSFERTNRRTELNFVQSVNRQQRLKQLQELVKQETSFERTSHNTKLNFVQSEDRQQRLKQLQELVKQETSFERTSHNTKLNFVQSEDRQQRLKQLQELVGQELGSKLKAGIAGANHRRIAKTGKAFLKDKEAELGAESRGRSEAQLRLANLNRAPVLKKNELVFSYASGDTGTEEIKTALSSLLSQVQTKPQPQGEKVQESQTWLETGGKKRETNVVPQSAELLTSERYVERLVSKEIDANISDIADRVYEELDNKLRVERYRMGIF